MKFKHIILLSLMPSTLVAEGINTKLIPVAPGYAATSVNTAVFRNNSVYTHDSTQYISFYNQDGYVTLGKRILGSTDWDIQTTIYRGRVEDAHNVISMIVDNNNIIHVAFDHHGDSLRYCKSVAPGSLVLGELEPMIGTLEDDVTYPEFYSLPSGDLLFAYRSGASGRGNLVLNKYDASTGNWSRLQDVLIDGENQRNAYWQLYVDNSGTIHLSWVWRESWLVETNHDICYARSSDGGNTWTRSDGTPYSLPITLDTAEVAVSIPQNRELINQTSMYADDYGHVYIATYWRDEDSDMPQYWIVWNDGQKWSTRAVGQRTTPFSLSGGGTKMIPIARPRIAAAGDSVYYICRDADDGSKAKVFYGNLSAPNWEYAFVTDFPVGAWEPTYDVGLWNSDRKLHIFIQNSSQGDGEKTTTLEPQMVYILEISE